MIHIPKDYSPKLNQYDLQRAIDFIKLTFQSELATILGLQRVSAPLFVYSQSGLNDNLSGKERPVAFDIPALSSDAEVVHSLAKWKREALWRYGFKNGEGLFTDMNAIRRDEILDNTHSIYVDQWDWEKIIADKDRNIDFLKETIQEIVHCICNVNHLLKSRFPQLDTKLTRQVTFITAKELEKRYPNLDPDDRETAFAKEHGTIAILAIGHNLKNGSPHSMRAPDYDDWDLNADIIFWDEVLEAALEISSMGIRVDAKALEKQLKLASCEDRRELDYHKKLLSNQLPLTIGGGIGQSRLCMLMIGCMHIGEVQASLWDEETRELCQEKGIFLL